MAAAGSAARLAALSALLAPLALAPLALAPPALALLALALLASGCASAPDAEEQQAELDYELTFRGNSSFPAFRLRRVIEDLLIDFSRNGGETASILDAATDLQDHYVDQGFPDARVDYTITREPKLGVAFEIVEGPRVTMSEPEITGNDAFDKDELLPLWRRTNSGLLGTGDPYFVESDLRAFAAAMRDRYRAFGFLRAEVQGPKIDREAGAGRASVSFQIVEGAPYTLTEVTLDDAFTALGVRTPEAELQGKRYSVRDLQTARLRVREALRDRGYVDPQVQLEVEVDHESHTARARIDGAVGERARVVGYTVSGLDRTARGVVESEIAFQAGGEWFSGSAIEQTISDLYTTGLFEKVRVETRPVAPGEVELDVIVEELEAREVSFLLGYGSYEQLRGGVFYTDRNLFGLGHYLRAGAKASLKGYGTDVTWTEPTLFDSDTSLSATTFFKQREEPSFTDQSIGFSTALSRRLFENVGGRLGYSLESRDGTDIDPSLLTAADSEFLLTTLFTELNHDTRDSVLFPERGHREIVKVEYASKELGGDVEFLRLTGQASAFLPLGEKWTFGVHAETGLIWSLDDQPIPVQERFYNGGHDTVRSFDQSELGPRLPNGVPIGGEFRNVFSAELRFPIVSLLSGAAFVDAGNVGQSVDAYGLSNLRLAIGGGLRLNLPIGPVRVDAGFNPDPEVQEEDYALHVSVGFPF